MLSIVFPVAWYIAGISVAWSVFYVVVLYGSYIRVSFLFPVDRHLDCFQFGALMNRPSVNTLVTVFLDQYLELLVYREGAYLSL